MNATKKCIKCGKRKKIEMFYIRKDNGKYRNTCKICQYDQAKKRKSVKK